jgi:hypothetical protein
VIYEQLVLEFRERLLDETFDPLPEGRPVGHVTDWSKMPTRPLMLADIERAAALAAQKPQEAL